MADHPDLAIGAGELRGPLHRVVAVFPVGRVVTEVFDVAARLLTPAHVLPDKDVAARGPPAPRAVQYPAIGRPLHHHTEGPVAHRPRDVGRQMRAATRENYTQPLSPPSVLPVA